MWKRSFAKSRATTRSMVSVICIAVAALLLVGCAPAYNTRPGGGYGGGYGGQPGYGGNQQCYQGCGYVRDIRQVQLGANDGNSNGAALGTVIGAVVGGLIGHQVGGGKGKTAATVAGAVGGGFAGHEIGERSGYGGYGWQVVVQLNNGQYATVTQRSAPQVRVGDYVMVRNNEVYRY
jgi:outer membrane lipoprotein SlyB